MDAAWDFFIHNKVKLASEEGGEGSVCGLHINIKPNATINPGGMSGRSRGKSHHATINPLGEVLSDALCLPFGGGGSIGKTSGGARNVPGGARSVGVCDRLVWEGRERRMIFPLTAVWSVATAVGTTDMDATEDPGRRDGVRHGGGGRDPARRDMGCRDPGRRDL